MVVRKPVVGKSKDLKLKSVVTTRSIDLFVSRLHPSTSGTELVNCVQEVASQGNVEVGDIKSVKLQSKFESLYSSFHVSMRVNANDLSHALEIFMGADSWHLGCLLKGTINPKMEAQNNKSACLKICSYNCRSLKKFNARYTSAL